MRSSTARLTGYAPIPGYQDMGTGHSVHKRGQRANKTVTRNDPRQCGIRDGDLEEY